MRCKSIFLAIVFALAACGCGRPVPLSTAAASADRRVFVDDSGYQLAFDTIPRRIVSVAPSLTEVVAAVGCESALVAVTMHCDFPSSVKLLPQSGSYVRPNIEAIVAMKPDLVLMVLDGAPKEAIVKLRSLGLNVALLKSEGYDDIRKNILWVGDLLGSESAARRVSSDLARRYDAVKAVIASCPKPRALYAIAVDPVITAGRGSFIHDLITDAGGINIAGDIDQPYPRLTLESVIARAPDVILFARGTGPEAAAPKQREYWLRWREIPAVRDDRLREVSSSVVNRPSPRIVDGLAQIAIVLHPEMKSAIEAALGP